MPRLPKIYYLLALLILTVIFTGCELSRDSSDLSDPGPVSDLPPTLAPLGAEIEVIAEATSVPTVIDAQTAAADTTPQEVEVAQSLTEPVTEASSSAEPADIAVVSGNDVEEASSVAPETFVPPTEEASADDIVVPQEAIVVDAPSADLPTGGPVAANPPASQTSGNYDTATFSDSTYIVQPGDTLYSIALRYGTTVEAIVYTNGLPSDFIYAGQELNIPSGDVTVPSYEQAPYQQPSQPQPSFQQPYIPNAGDNYHIIAPGETLYRIALQYGTSVDAIAGANGIPYPYIIQAGQQLMIPAPGTYAGPPPPPAAGFYDQQPYYQNSYPPQPPPYDSYAPQDGNFPNPGNAGTHTVAPGETLYSIALRYGTSAEALAEANGLFNPNQIYVGQVLYLP